MNTKCFEVFLTHLNQHFFDDFLSTSPGLSTPCSKVDGRGWQIQLENGLCRMVEDAEEPGHRMIVKNIEKHRNTMTHDHG
jgi:hypothetical protein